MERLTGRLIRRIKASRGELLEVSLIVCPVKKSFGAIRKIKKQRGLDIVQEQPTGGRRDNSMWKALGKSSSTCKKSESYCFRS